MMNEEETASYLELIGKSGSILGLESIRSLMEELGNIQDKLKVIHIAGTNGKGSVCAMLTSILMEAGYHVGTYTSPAVFDRKEQYQINRTPVSGYEFSEMISIVKEACGRLTAKGKEQPTVFEVETAAAFVYFYKKKCQIVILETGMGGETDATNIVKNPLLSILTSVSMDHMGFLGNNLADITRIKAGIIKENGKVTAVRPQQKEIRQIIEEVCDKKQASLMYSDEKNAGQIHYNRGHLCFSYGEFGEIELSMLGAYQVQNGVCAIESAKILRKAGFEIDDSAIKSGLEKSQWEGRFSIICREPLFIIDGAHNEDAAKKLRKTLEMGFTNYKIIYIIGVLADKEHQKMLEIMLPLAWKVFTVTPDNPRALDGKKLADEAKKLHQDVIFCQMIKDAVVQSMKYAVEGPAVIVAFGSLSYLKEVKSDILQKTAVYNSDVRE